MTPTAVACIVIALVASWCDVRSRRLPNVLTFGAAIAAILFRIAVGGVSGVASGAAGLLLGLAFFFPVFALGGMGAGDLKLLGAFGAWLGPAGVVWAAMYAGVAGGVLALGVAAFHGYLRTAISNIWTLLCHWRVVGLTPLHGITLESSSSPRLPYALPISAGTLLALWLH